MGLKIILCITFFSYNLLTGAESPVSEKREQQYKVEYAENLNKKEVFLRKPPFCPQSLNVDTDVGTTTTANYSYDVSFPLSAKTTFPTGNGDPDFVSRTYSDGMGRNIYTVKSTSNGNFAITGRLVYDGTGKVVRKGQSSWATSGE
ncbi:hypothetical protein LEP1GSC125_1594, partial [Leptospira mayottensis 200901122]